MANVGVADTPTVSKPRAAATATTECAGFLGDAAFGAYGSDSDRRGCYIWTHIKDANGNKT